MQVEDISSTHICVRIGWSWRPVGLRKGGMTERERARERLGKGGGLVGNSFWISNLRSWDGSWVYSDIINKERKVERGTGFMKKTMSCVLVEVHTKENSKQRDRGMVFSSLEVFLFPIEEGRIWRAVKPNNKSIYYYKRLDLEWAQVSPTSCVKCQRQHIHWTKFSCLPVRLSSHNKSRNWEI